MADIGSSLREARMRARIDITEVETRTKIRAKYLRAIENEEWDLLPGPVYVKSFLRTYGDYLGLDSRYLIDEYKRRYERPSDGELRPIASLSRERERAARGPLIPPWALVGAVVVLLVVALYLVGRAGKSGPAAGSAAKAPPSTATAPAPVRRPAAHRHSGTVKIAMRALGQVYVCAVDQSGRKLIPGVVYAAGQPIPAVGGRRVLLTIGNARIHIRANGRPITVPPSASAVRYLVSAASERRIALGAAPGCP